MAKLSAGLLMYRGTADALEVFLVHPGGPWFAAKDAGTWSIPKGLVATGEDARAAALREFTEEVGLPVSDAWISLGSIVQKGGKKVVAWAFEGDAPPQFVPKSNTFELEWPPRSGRLQRFVEVDRAEFFAIDQARIKLLPAQHPLLDRLLQHLRHPAATPPPGT